MSYSSLVFTPAVLITFPTDKDSLSFVYTKENTLYKLVNNRKDQSMYSECHEVTEEYMKHFFNMHIPSHGKIIFSNVDLKIESMTIYMRSNNISHLDFTFDVTRVNNYDIYDAFLFVIKEIKAKNVL